MSETLSPVSLDEIRADLSNYRENWVIIYGSWIHRNMTPMSDIDICIISHDFDKKRNIKFYSDLLGKAHPRYDVKLFELLPLYIQGDIMEKYEVIFGNEVDISYYLYKFRKLWQDNLVKIQNYSI